LLGQDVDEAEAGRRAFGDLKQLQKRLEEYIQKPRFRYARMKASAELGEKDIVTRALPAAESTAVRGDFHLRMGRIAEARELLEQALRLDPNLALARESMGFLHYRLGERDEAAQCFAQAVKLDSHSYLAHYFHAMLIVERGAQQEFLPEAETSLRRAIELNPNFAPAYATLAAFYSLRKETLEQAFTAARKAVQLEPGDAQYSIGLGQVLLRMERIADARFVGEHALAAAKSPEMRALGESFMRQIDQYQDYVAQRKRYDEEARAAREQLQARVSAEARIDPPADRNRPAESTQVPASVAEAKPRLYSALGKITEVSCASPPAMNLTLTLGALVMRLHATNFFKVDYLTTSWKPPANFNPCTHLKGLSAQLSYKLVQGQDYDGEIASVEVRK
jgi:tetratricopeptide (TPR) repeat protein